MTHGFHRTPFALPTLLSKHSQLRQAIKAGGVQRDMALAKIAVGQTLLATMSMYVGSGIIHGKGPLRKDLRKMLENTGWKEDTIQIGDEYYQINRLDPFGMMLGLTARYVEVAKYLPEDQALSLGMALVIAISDSAMNKTYLENARQFGDAVFDTSDMRTRKFGNWLKKQAATMLTVPGHAGNLKAIGKQMDPVYREAETLLQHVCKQTPVCSKLLPAMPNWFGEERPDTRWLPLMNPIGRSTQKNDRVGEIATELVRARVRTSMPQRILFGRAEQMIEMEPREVGPGVRLDPWMYGDYVGFFAGTKSHDGEYATINGKTKTELFHDLINSKAWHEASDGPDGLKQKMTMIYEIGFKTLAKKMLMDKYPLLREKMEQAKQQKGEALTK